MNNLSQWMIAATADELRNLASSAGTSVKHLHHLRLHYRGASSELAGRIADAAEALRRRSKGRLPELTRADLCDACKECPYFKQCRGK